MTPDAERACLARLQEMDVALARMERELPEDVRQVGAEARQRVALWLARMAAGNVSLSQFTEAMREISAMMDALTSRLLLVPWDGPRPGFKS
jgi:hypothetical protein